MKKIWVWVCGILLALFLAGGVIIATILLRLDPQTLKTQIISAIHEATGRELSIAGEFHMDVFPWLSVRAQQVELSNAPGFSGPFLELSSLKLRIRLFPLLFSRVEMAAVEMDGVVLHLGRDAQGRNNWDDMGQGDQSKDGIFNISSDQKVFLTNLFVDGLRLVGRMQWSDETNGQAFTVEDFHLDLEEFAVGDSFSIQSSGKIILPEALAHFVLGMDSTIDTRTLWENVDFSATLSGKSFPHGPEEVRLQAVRLSSDGEVKDVRFEGLGIRLQTGTKGGKAGQSHLEVFFPEAEKRTEYFSFLPYAHSLALLDSFTAEWTRHENYLDISSFQIVMYNSTIQGNASVDIASGATHFSAQAQRLDLDLYQKALDADFSAHNQSVVLPNFLSEVNGTLAVDELVVQNALLTNAQCVITTTNDTVQISDFTSQAYGGTLLGTAAIQLGKPEISWTYKASGVQVEPLLQALYGHVSLSGVADSEGELTSAGLARSVFGRTLSGNLHFKIRNGAIHGINIADLMRDEIRALKGQSPGESGPNRTSFLELSGSSVIATGLKTTQDLFLLAPRFQMRGKGQVDFGKEQLNLNILIALNGAEGKFEEGILGVASLPLTVTGSFSEPEMSMDTGSLLQALGEKSGRTVLDGVEKLGSGVVKGVQGVFRGLLRRLP